MSAMMCGSSIPAAPPVLPVMLTLPADTWIRLGVWLVIGFAIYFGYSRKHSVLRTKGV